MLEDKRKLEEKFNIIKNKGWIKTTRNGSTGVGKTFEDLINKNEDSFEIPDFGFFEIKTKLLDCFSKHITLFNYSPEGSIVFKNKQLHNDYGYKHSKNKNFKVLNNSASATKRTSIGIHYQFLLKIDSDQKRIFLCVFDSYGKLIEKDAYWDFDLIKEKLYRKLSYLCIISAQKKIMNYNVYYKYVDIKFYKLKNFEAFLNLLEQGYIRITFKLNTFMSGIRYGQVHDHGTGFDLNIEAVEKLYDEI